MSQIEKTTSYDDFKKITKCNIRWMHHRFILLCVSVLLNVFSVGTLWTQGLNLSIDFRGGVLLEVGFKNAPETKDIRKFLIKQGIDGVVVQSFGKQEFLINVGNSSDIDANHLVTKIRDALNTQYADNISFRRTETVGPKVGDELVHTSVLAVTLSIVAMLIYIWARFELPFAMGSVVALAHDVLITLGIFAFFRIEFGLPIIAALLTIVGYSMNDTVVIYDRIRENLVKYRKALLPDIIDLSVNETFARTLVTAGTTLISLLALMIFGGSVIKPFVTAMIIGVLVGTYSSIFVASPVLLIWGVKNKFKSAMTKKADVKKPIGIIL